MSSNSHFTSAAAEVPTWFMARKDGSFVPISAQIADELPAGVKFYGVAPSLQTQASFYPAEIVASMPQTYEIMPRVNLPQPGRGQASIVHSNDTLQMEGSEEYSSLSEASSEASYRAKTIQPGGMPDHQQQAQEIQYPGMPAQKFIVPTQKGQIPIYQIPKTKQAGRLENTAAKSSPTLHSTATLDARLTPTTTARPLPPSGIEPDESKKRYCAYWLRHGECDFAQQGCKFKHEMPEDRATLEQLGFRTVPKWYLEKQHGKLWIGPSAAVVDGNPDRRLAARNVPYSQERNMVPFGCRIRRPHGNGAGVTKPFPLQGPAAHANSAVPGLQQRAHMTTPQPALKPLSLPRKSPGEWIRSSAEKSQASAIGKASPPVSNAVNTSSTTGTPKREHLPGKQATPAAQMDDLIDLDYPIILPDASLSPRTNPGTSSNGMTSSSPSSASDLENTPSSSGSPLSLVNTNTTSNPPSATGKGKPTLTGQVPTHPRLFTTKPAHPSPHTLAVEARNAQMAAEGALRIAEAMKVSIHAKPAAVDAELLPGLSSLSVKPVTATGNAAKGSTTPPSAISAKNGKMQPAMKNTTSNGTQTAKPSTVAKTAPSATSLTTRSPVTLTGPAAAAAAEKKRKALARLRNQIGTTPAAAAIAPATTTPGTPATSTGATTPPNSEQKRARKPKGRRGGRRGGAGEKSQVAVAVVDVCGAE